MQKPIHLFFARSLIGLAVGCLALSLEAAAPKAVKAPQSSSAQSSAATTAAEVDVPDVVDPDEAAKALAAGISPKDALPRSTVDREKTAVPASATADQAARGTEAAESSPKHQGGTSAAESEDDPIAAIAAGAAESTQSTPESAVATQREQASAEGEAPAQAKDSQGQNGVDTTSAAAQAGQAAPASGVAGANGSAKAGEEKDYGEDHPDPNAQAAAVWSDQVRAKTAVIEPPSMGAIPTFLGVTPYVSTRADVEALFKGKAHYADDAPLGPRSVVTGDDLGLGAQSLLIGYTANGLVSDLYVQVGADQLAHARAVLQEMTAKMDASGLWIKRSGENIWRTAYAEMELSPDPEGGMTVLYGAVARQPWETRLWLDEDPNNRYPRFSGLLIGRSTLDEVVTLMKPRAGCQLGTPAVFPNGSFALTLTGACFGLPKEERSDLWFDADSHRLVRLFINTKASAEDLEAVEAALAKRYSATSEAGVFQVGTAPTRNVWLPRITVLPTEGRLEFDVPVDGMTSAAVNWQAIQKADEARRAEAARIDRLFE